jgi:glycine cleavage system H protein
VRPLSISGERGQLAAKESNMKVPADCRYTENDEWIKVDGDQATIGISDYAQEQLSDVVYFEVTSEAGTHLNKGEVVAVVESVKAASDVYMPVSGELLEINSELASHPETVNSDPYGEAWMVKVKLADAAEPQDLMDAPAYQKYCEGRAH